MLVSPISEAEIDRVRGGEFLHLPLKDGRVGLLVFRGGAYHLRPFETRDIIGLGNAPREGASAERPPD